MGLALPSWLHGVGVLMRAVKKKIVETLTHSYTLFLIFYSGQWCILNIAVEKSAGDEYG